jgi:signal transduction histidine kinase
VVASVLTFADIGDQLAREEVERVARRAVEVATAAKSELLRLVAKELEVPLNADAMKTLAGLLSR